MNTAIPKEFKKGLYRHYKGNEYTVEDIVIHSETQQWLVLYRPCYGEQLLWVRPFDMFYEKVINSEGMQVDRFALIEVI